MKKWIGSFLMAASLAAAPQAVVFDFGGVLTTEPDREAIVQFLRDSFHLSETEFETANLEKRKAIKSGKTDAEFWVQYGKKRGTPLPSDWPLRFKSVLKDSFGVNRAMFGLVAELKERQIPVGLLSNIDERLSKLIREFGFYQPFDPCLLSHEIGAEKPDLKVYRILVETLGYPAGDILFIDDLAENVQGAQDAGLDAILFHSPEQVRSELQKRGIAL